MNKTYNFQMNWIPLILLASIPLLSGCSTPDQISSTCVTEISGGERYCFLMLAENGGVYFVRSMAIIALDELSGDYSFTSIRQPRIGLADETIGFEVNSDGTISIFDEDGRYSIAELSAFKLHEGTSYSDFAGDRISIDAVGNYGDFVSIPDEKRENNDISLTTQRVERKN